MEAKDTVTQTDVSQLFEDCPSPKNLIQNIRLEQAEISFKAGMKELMDLWRELAANNESVKIPFEVEEFLKERGNIRTVEDAVLAIKSASYVKLSEDQSCDLGDWEHTDSTIPIHIRVYHVMWKQGWRKVIFTKGG